MIEQRGEEPVPVSGPCQVIEVDGQPVRVQNRGLPLTDADLKVLRDFRQFLRDQYASEAPD